LLEEFEKTKEQTDELNNQKAICGRSKVQAEQVLNEKENEIKSLMESLLKTKVWTCLFGDDITDYGNLDLEVKSDLENDVHLHGQTAPEIVKGSFNKYICIFYLNFSSSSLRTLLKRYGESGQPCLVPDFGGIGSSFSPFNLMLAVGLLYIAFIMLRWASILKIGIEEE
ncbi:putative cutaneous T-cell lymphoma-associated antigen 5 like protein, partial [Cricetulus griseus]